MPAPAYIWLLTSLAIGTPALSFIGAFGAAITVGIKRGGLLLSLLVLPLYIPTLIFGAVTVTKSIEGTNPLPSLVLLAGLTLFSLVIMPFTSALALKSNLKS